MDTMSAHDARILKEATHRSRCRAAAAMIDDAIKTSGREPRLDDGEFRIASLTAVATGSGRADTRIDLLSLAAPKPTRPWCVPAAIDCDETRLEVLDVDGAMTRLPIPALIERTPNDDATSAPIHVAGTSAITVCELKRYLIAGTPGETLADPRRDLDRRATHRAIRTLAGPGVDGDKAVLAYETERALTHLLRIRKRHYTITIRDGTVSVECRTIEATREARDDANES